MHEMGFEYVCVCVIHRIVRIYWLIHNCLLIRDTLLAERLYGSFPIGASTPACVIRSPMLFSRSSIRVDISSIREIT